MKNKKNFPAWIILIMAVIMGLATFPVSTGKAYAQSQPAASPEASVCDIFDPACFIVFLAVVAYAVQNDFTPPAPPPTATLTPTPVPTVTPQLVEALGDSYYTSGTCPLCSRYIRFNTITTANCPHVVEVDGTFSNGFIYDTWKQLAAVSGFNVTAGYSVMEINPIFYWEYTGTDKPTNYTAQIWCN